MKYISKILLFALLLLVGTVITYSDAQCTNAIAGVSPAVLQFPYTPIGQHSDTSYVISWSGLTWRPGPDGQVGGTDFRLTIMAPPSFQLSWDGVTYRTTWYNNAGTIVAWPIGFMMGSGNYGGSRRCYVRYAPTNDSLGIQGQLTNDCDDQFENISNPTVSLVSSPLPIQLASFMVQKYGANGTRLTWTTVSEISNFGFEAQRSPDGKTFASIAGSFIPGNGTTNQSHTYSYVDAVPAGTTSYRLKQIDLDGTVNYTEPVQLTTTTSVKEQKPNVFALEQNYPNPFNPTTQIAFATTKEGPVSLQVYDVLGREVATLVNENRNPGRYTEHFNASQLASGVYLYVLRTLEGQRSGRMMLSK